MVCSVNVGYLTGRILHCVLFFFFYNFASGVWLSLPDWQHLQSWTGVYYGEDSAEEIWIWPQYYWPSVNYGTLLTDCRSRQNGKHMQFTFIFKILILFFHMNNQMINCKYTLIFFASTYQILRKGILFCKCGLVSQNTNCWPSDASCRESVTKFHTFVNDQNWMNFIAFSGQ